MPNQPKTPGHTVRVPDDEWIPAMDKGEAEGMTTATAVVRMLLRKYVAGAVLGALILASFAGSAQASAPVAASNVVTEAIFVATVRQFGAGTAIERRTDAQLIKSAKMVCADIAAGQTRATYWQQIASAYSPELGKIAGIHSYTQWVSHFAAWRQASILTFCPKYL